LIRWDCAIGVVVQRLFQTSGISLTPDENVGYAGLRLLRSQHLETDSERLSLAKYAAAYTRSWTADSPNAHVRFRSERDRSLEDAALVREEMRIKDIRMASVEPRSARRSRWWRRHV
jgi:hypothetical protein